MMQPCFGVSILLFACRNRRAGSLVILYRFPELYGAEFRQVMCNTLPIKPGFKTISGHPVFMNANFLEMLTNIFEHHLITPAFAISSAFL
jgi:hypothetical protein